MYSVKIFTNSLNISIEDDLIKVKEYLVRQIKETAKYDFDISFVVEETTVSLTDSASRLMMPLDGKYDVIIYMFDRFEQNYHSSLAFPLQKSCGVYIQTSTFDDVVGGTFVSIIHELMHTFFYRAKSLGINIQDQMDITYHLGVPKIYFNNDLPESLEGNFATCFLFLSQYWSKIAPSVAPIAPVVPVAECELTKWGLLPSLEKKALVFLLETKKAGYNLRITHGYRDPAYQEKLYAQGRTLPGKIITNATSKNSFHCKRRAFDVAVVGKDPYPKNYNWKAVADIAIKVGLTPGYYFKTFQDRVHFQT